MTSETMADDSHLPKTHATKSINNNSTNFSAFCSVCLEAVSDAAGERSIAKLKCGHNFHLDCIGSAFNAKGRMQCPNCRQVEQGQWLYANGCFIHEDFSDDFNFEEEVEAYSGSVNVQFTPTPWCPHQGSYAHVSLTLEDLDNFRIGYMDPIVGVRHGPSRASPSAAGHVCPYLAAQGLTMGRPSSHAEDVFGLHQHRPGRNRRTAAPSSGHASSGQQQSSGTSSSNATVSYEGPLQSFRQHILGFVVGNPQPLHAGVSQGTAIAGAVPRHVFGQPLHVHNLHGVQRSSHPHAPNTSRQGNGYNSRRTRQNEHPMNLERAPQVSATAGAWAGTENANEYGSYVAPTSINHTSNPMTQGVWSATTDGQVDPWTTGIYASSASVGASSNWWPWVPAGNNHVQGLAPNATSSAYHHDGQFFQAGLFPGAAAPLTTFSEQPSDSPYTWVFSGF